MKKLITLFFVVFYISSIQAQDAQLLENDWYLEKLLIEGEEVFQPDSNCSEQGRVYFFVDVISVDNLCCEFSCTTPIYYTETTGFEFGDGENDGVACLLNASCNPDEPELEYAFLHQNVYFVPADPDILFNPYTYEITENGDDLALVVTNGEGDKAYYNNVLLNTQDFQDPQVSIYPNPVKDKLFIESLMPIKKIEIYAINGKEVLSKTANTASLDVSKFVAGVYFVRITTGAGSLVKQFIKK